MTTLAATAARSAAKALGRRPVGGWIALGVAAAVLLIVVLWAAFPQWFTGYDPVVGVPAEKLAAPTPAHPLGTDYLGRDLLARMVYGTRTSLLSALLAVVVGLGLGLALGLAAGFGARLVDGTVMRLVDLLLAVPELLLAMLLVAVLGFSAENAAFAIGLSSVAGFARLTRAEVLRVRQRRFVEAARLSGARAWSIVVRHTLPNIGSTLLALALLRFGGAILGISTLSFLGFGAPPPAPEWGGLVAEGINYFYSAPWLLYGPAAIIVGVVLAANRVATAARSRGNA